MTAIERVELHEYTYGVDNLGGNPRVYNPGVRLETSTFAVRIVTDDGLVGEYCPQHGGKAAQLAQVRMVAPLLLGRDPFQRQRLYEDMKHALRHVAFLGVAVPDIALWDLAAKAYGVSVRELLGGYRSTIPAYASTFQGDRNGGLSTKEQYGDFAEQCRELGYRAFKIHGWPDANAAEEEANVFHVAERVGSDMTLMLDPACELFTFADALRVGRACDEVGMLWYEDPLRDSGTSIHAHRKLRQLLKTPLLITEQVRGIEAHAEWITSEATDFVRADPELDLGITGTMRIAHLAEAFGLDVELHGCGPAHRACISAIRNSNYYEMVLVGPRCANPIPPVYADDYSDQLEAIQADGTIPVPDGPGLGVTYDWDFIKANTTDVSVYSTKS